MRTFLVFAVLAALAACGAPQKKSPTADEGPAVPATCCCKTTPLTSVDGKPVYERGINRMECSTKQGECVDDVQCNGSSRADSGDGTPPPPPLEPSATSP